MIAIIPAAGHGTRFLPVTRAVPKEMLPIGSRPALELIVDEARAASATRIILIISEGKELIRRYFEDQMDITFVYQREQRGLGHAVLQAAEEAGATEEPVLILLGDALVVGCTAAKILADASVAAGGASVIGCERVPMELVSRYGILKPVDFGRANRPGEPQPVSPPDGVAFALADMIEKPSVEEAPSNLAVAGRYLLDGAIFRYLATQTPGKGGEIQLTDAIKRMMAEKAVFGCVYPGKRQDIGNPDGYYAALRAFRAAQQTEVK